MRIRKAFSTLSDLNRSPVLVQLNDATTTSPKLSCTRDLANALLSLSDHPHPSDQSLPPINGCDDSLLQHKKQEILVEDGRGQKDNDFRNGSILNAQTLVEVFSTSRPSSHKQDWRWKEGDKAFPLKKHRGSIATNSNENNNNIKKKRKMKTIIKKKCYDSNEWDEEDEDNINNEEVVVVRKTKQKKKKVRGGALMEGSRCSRVNGRGWRCCQPTLVGYSLCEHHLGKGRLRSMTSVRNRSLVAETSSIEKPISQTEPLSLEKITKFDGEYNDEEKPLMIAKKKKKKKKMMIGTVKARSISSLLGQTNSDLVVAENNK